MLPGQYYDAETSTHYHYFRDYDPAVGRYAQSDPIGLKGGMNTFVYANASPLRFIDALALRKRVPCPPGVVSSGDRWIDVPDDSSWMLPVVAPYALQQCAELCGYEANNPEPVFPPLGL